jgi:hypothetical protein
MSAHLAARLKRFWEIPFAGQRRPPGLKPKLIPHALRGAEAPLFHGTALI